MAFLAAIAVASLDVDPARAEFLFVKIDLSKIYENMPKVPAGGNTGGVPNPMVRPMPMPVPVPMPNPMGGPGLPVVTPQVEGPFVYVCIDIKSKRKFEEFAKQDKKERTDEEILSGDYTGGIKVDFHTYGKDARFIVWPDYLKQNVMKYAFIRHNAPSREFEKNFKNELAGSKDAKKYVTAATWALMHGLPAEFHATMDELKKIDPKHPVAVNYMRVKDGLAAKSAEFSKLSGESLIAADDPAIRQLKKELTEDRKAKYHVVNSEKGFYFALSNLPTQVDGGVKKRADRLTDVMENFYYWFAMNEQLPQPPLPQYRQMLMVTEAPEFYAKHSQWGAQPFTNDGVTPRRDNFILSAYRPLDDAYRVFESNNQDLWTKKIPTNKESFINGLIWDKDKTKLKADADLFLVAYTQTLLIVQRAIEDQSEYATLSHEGSRQLLFSSGILPRNVHTPEWIASGLASYFETPPGALYKGIGLPSWTNLVTFRHLRDQKKIDLRKNAPDVLMNMLCDRYFRAAQRYAGELNDAPDKEKLNERIREEMDLACSTSWAFAYYMIERRRQPQILFRYCQELNALPRDLDLDERALEACFAKVFDVADPANPSRIDRNKLKTLAEAWIAEMDTVTLEAPELQHEYLELRKLAAKRAASMN